MKKTYVAAAVVLGISIISGVGSAVTITKALPKLNRYLVERRESILSNKTIFNSKEKVSEINIGNINIAYNTIVNVKKSKDNEVRVSATLINGKNYYVTDIKNGVLSVRLNDNKVLDANSGFDCGIYIGNDKRIHFLGKSYPIFNIPKEIIKKELDEMAISGVRIDRDLSRFDGNYESNAFQLNIEVPDSVDIVLDTKGYPEIDIEKGMIKNSVSLNSPDNVDSIKYDGEIKKFNIDITKERDNIISLTSFNNPKNIKEMNINVNRGTYFIGNIENGKIADKVVFNVGKSKLKLDKDANIYDVIKSEDKIDEYLVDNVLRNDDVSESGDSDNGSVESRINKLKDESNKVEEKKILLEKFGKEIDRNVKNEKNGYTYSDLYNNFYNEFDFSTLINRDMANEVTINAPDSNVRVELAKGYNPKMDIKTKKGIDMKYYLVDKISAVKIPNSDSLKDFNGNLYSYINKVDPKHSKAEKEMLPTVVVNSDFLRIVETGDDN